MKPNSIKYLVGQGVRNSWKNRMMSFASFCIMLVSLLMVGISVLAALNLNRIIGGLEDKNEAIVIIKDDTPQDQIDTMGDQLAKVGNISRVDFYSKDQALSDMVEDYDEDVKDVFKYGSDGAGDDNPLPDTYKISVADITQMKDTVAQISAFDNVENVKSPTRFAEVLINVRNIMSLISAAVVLALIVVSLVIISNTTRTSVFARRKEINIMKYVGATNSFIKIPFFVEGMMLGILAAIGALLLTKFAYDGIYSILSEYFQIWSLLGVKTLYNFNNIFWHVSIAYLAAGAVIGAIGSTISTGKYVKV